LASFLGDLADLVLRSGLFAKFIILLLATLSILSWAIMTQRMRQFTRFEASNQQFWQRFTALRAGRGTMSELAGWSSSQAGCVCAVYTWFHSEFWPTHLSRGSGPEQARLALGMLERGIDRVGAEVLAPLERPLGWLATLSTVAPFLGLLGTVWGIMCSFLQLGRQGSATLDVVGPGIAEALITTVAGLAVAIPSVVGYNSLARRAREQEQELARIGSVLADVVTEEATSSPTRV